ncbi:MAG TPA: nitroreductase/quinone reductase family protein [Kineosporiaceae bacterium]|nr:nitroreductase/quinone reductase family protein [Kineosporiaceae bacterium]
MIGSTPDPAGRGDSPHASPGTDFGHLPYAPGTARLLGPLRTGFRWVNRRFTGPVFAAGLGPLLSSPVTGSMLVLRTTGRKSGLVREAPLGYAIVDGRVMVVAGYGRDCHWFRNALADPRVEIALPGAVLAGTAEEVTDPDLRRRAFREVLRVEGVVGRLTLGDVAAADDLRVDELATALPVLAITPTAVRPGPYDPGGTFWRIPALATAAGAVLLAAGLRHARTSRARRGGRCC